MAEARSVSSSARFYRRPAISSRWPSFDAWSSKSRILSPNLALWSSRRGTRSNCSSGWKADNSRT